MDSDKTNPYRVGDTVKVTYPIPKNEALRGYISRVASCKDGIYSLQVDNKTYTFKWDELTIYKEISNNWIQYGITINRPKLRRFTCY